MRMHAFHRTQMLLGGEGFERLQHASVCVVGLGGVGSYAAEAIVRAGVGHVTLVDFDDVCLTNINRQLHADRKTVGQMKAQLMYDRAKAINPKVDVRALQLFYNRSTQPQVLDRDYDYVFDCIDNMTAKIHLLSTCVRDDRQVISAMGAGGRLDPTRIQVSDISKTHTDPFARIVRDCLRDLNIDSGVECVWTDESPAKLDEEASAAFRCICPGKSDNEVHSCEERFQVQGSVSWMPPMFGLTMAGVAVNRILGRTLHVDRAERPRGMSPVVGKSGGDRRKELLKSAGYVRSNHKIEV
ncbi:MAG: tRNA A37 threonylcarbamoyladenosine dehydratase [Kiritimatiellia bacterium]|jgi:tRNA A37 threonylcarbamoyladenosine dehydratase